MHENCMYEVWRPKMEVEWTVYENQFWRQELEPEDIM